MTKYVKLLLIINIVFFLLVTILKLQGIPLNGIMALYPVDHELFSWNQFVTYMFSHASIPHLLMNMIVLWSLGPRLEVKFGSDNFLNFYLFSGILGGLAHITLYNSPVIGASAAIWGILAVYAVVFSEEKLYLWFILPIKSSILISLLFLYELISIFSQDGISHIGHVGGALSGLIFLLLFYIFTRNEKVPK